MPATATLPQRVIVTNFPLSPTTGPITITITGQQGNPANPLTASLSGSGAGWTTDTQGLQLTEPGNYQLTFEMNTNSQFTSLFTLLGLQVFFLDSSNSNTPNATIFFPATSSGTAVINLLHNVESGSSVVYQMFVGIQNEMGIFWPDPTISFDPQG